MSTFDRPRFLSGPVAIYDYTRDAWDEMRANLDKPMAERTGSRMAVSDDSAGADAAARYIYAVLKKNPTLVTEALPPDYKGILSIIENPGNPLTWVTQKATQAAKKAVHSVEVNLDKPAQFLQDVDPFAAGNILDYRKVLAAGAVLGVAYLFAPAIFAGIFKAIGKKRKR
jgi:hypothetical protein